MFATRDLFDLKALPDALLPLFSAQDPWDILNRLDDFLTAVRSDHQGEVHGSAVLRGEVYLEAGACIDPHALVEGPAWIGAGAKVGHGAYLRGGVVLAPGAVVGHSCEVKHAVLLNEAKAPHFNYIGDAVLGREVNLGAGVKLANYNAFGHGVKVEGRDTGLRKFSAALGDEVSIGCNAVLSPGTLVGPRTVIYHGAMVRGVVPADSIVKHRSDLDIVARR